MNREKAEFFKRVGPQLRRNTFEALALFGSKKQQLKYQNDVPIADVLAEMFADWDDWYGQNSEDFKSLFTDQEQKSLDYFDKLIDEVYETDSSTTLDEFIGTPDWQKLHEAARSILKELNQELPPE